MGETKTVLTWLLRDEVSPAVAKINGKLKDAEKSATATGGRFGKLGGAISGLLSPTALLYGGVGALAGAFVNMNEISERVELQENSLNAALVAHGTTLDANREKLDAMIKSGEQYGVAASEMRDALITLVQAGISVEDAQKHVNDVLNLAHAKGISAADAAKILAKASTGAAKGLADLGIKLPGVTDKTALYEGATNKAAVQAQLFADAADAVTKSTGDQSTAVSEVTKKTTELGNKWEKFSSQTAPVLQEALAKVLDVLLGIIDAAANAMKNLGDMGKAFTQATGGTNVNAFTGAAQGGINPATGKPWGQHAAGGWVGMNGPELSWLGEKGPEYVIPNHQLGKVGGGSSGVTLVGVTEAQIMDMVDRGMYFRLRRASAGA